MHELGLAQETLDIVLATAKREGAQRVVSIRLRIGDWSGVVPEAMQFALETIVEGTAAAGARIELIRVPPACRCAACDTRYEVSDYDYACPVCGAINYDVEQGKEMELLALEVA